MAYPTYFPQYYPNPYIPLQQMPQMQQPIYQNQMSGASQPQQTVQKSEPQVQSGGFVPVPSEQVAREYPVANGVSVTFKDENAPYVYTKTMGFSQLDRPVFEKYRLVKEEDTPQTSIQPHTDTLENEVDNSLPKELKAEIEQIKGDIDDMQKQIDALKEITKKPNTTAKKRDSGDD